MALRVVGASEEEDQKMVRKTVTKGGKKYVKVTKVTKLSRNTTTTKGTKESGAKKGGKFKTSPQVTS